MKKYLTLLLAILCLAMLAGCEKGGSRELTRKEIAQANEAFLPELWDEEKGELVINPLSRFFTSHYADPKDIDLMEFLWNCPIGTTLEDEDAEEFQKVMAQTGAKGHWEVPSEYIVPTHRYRREDVSAMLQTYAGITAEELTSWENVIYLEEYDAFYNFTSDYAPGCFQCTGGKIVEDRVWLWSETEMLTLKKKVDGNYRIQSFQEIEE